MEALYTIIVELPREAAVEIDFTPCRLLDIEDNSFYGDGPYWNKCGLEGGYASMALTVHSDHLVKYLNYITYEIGLQTVEVHHDGWINSEEA